MKNYISKFYLKNIIKEKFLLIYLYSLYILICIATLFIWHNQKINSITGDEPHYLVMLKAITKFGTIEQTLAYSEEFNKKEIIDGWPQSDEPNITNTHTKIGKKGGLYPIHGLGLPILLIIPYFIAKILGAKILMILFSSATIYLTWKIVEYYTENKNLKFLITLSCVFTANMIPHSTQIFPDIPSGVISLFILYKIFIWNSQKVSSQSMIFMICAISFLPWLKISYTVTSAVLAIAVFIKSYLKDKSIKNYLTLILPALSCFILLYINYDCTGHILVPPSNVQPPLELSKISIMTLSGLIFDQNQGFLFQNPLFFAGIWGIGCLLRTNRFFFIIWLLVFLSLIVPNGLHTGWYGGYSFSGRYGLGAAIVFLFPTVITLVKLAQTKILIFRIIIISSISIQIYFFYLYAVEGTYLYNNFSTIFLNSYSIYYYPLQKIFPALYNHTWAYTYIKNYAWAAVILIIFLFQFMGKKISCVLLILSLMVCFTDQICTPPPTEPIVFEGKHLHGMVGGNSSSSRFADPLLDNKGYINLGPYIALRKGSYEITIKYAWNAPSNDKETESIFDIYDVLKRNVLFSDKLPHGEGELLYKTNFQIKSLPRSSYEFRIYWDGKYKFNIYQIHLREI